ncbi:uncharacterized protein BXZ73DRAFT_100549 [Epithele typhae]|uniref:uncharacterized protein n=1 Tax=Epithele typhae TaxID=378194 RepID=UPI00200821C1|nr:uncharacterized protein BXZ73DRAFT_100549 [Epithele typhae]KAH9935162.1 hypothetical protein BXZ73DRAFT_100549 [Epithele typhae]
MDLEATLDALPFLDNQACAAIRALRPAGKCLVFIQEAVPDYECHRAPHATASATTKLIIAAVGHPSGPPITSSDTRRASHHLRFGHGANHRHRGLTSSAAASWSQSGLPVVSVPELLQLARARCAALRSCASRTERSWGRSGAEQREWRLSVEEYVEMQMGFAGDCARVRAAKARSRAHTLQAALAKYHLASGARTMGGLEDEELERLWVEADIRYGHGDEEQENAWHAAGWQTIGAGARALSGSPSTSEDTHVGSRGAALDSGRTTAVGTPTFKFDKASSSGADADADADANVHADVDYAAVRLRLHPLGRGIDGAVRHLRHLAEFRPLKLFRPLGRDVDVEAVPDDRDDAQHPRRALGRLRAGRHLWLDLPAHFARDEDVPSPVEFLRYCRDIQRIVKDCKRGSPRHGGPACSPPPRPPSHRHVRSRSYSVQEAPRGRGLAVGDLTRSSSTARRALSSCSATSCD